MPRTPDRRPGRAIDEDDILSRDPTEDTTDYTVIRTGSVVTKEEWKRNIDSSLFKSIDYTRSGGVLTQEDIKVFASDGTTVQAHLRKTYTRTGGVLTGITITRLV